MANYNRDVNAQEVPAFVHYLERQITQDVSLEAAKKISGGASSLVTSTILFGWWYAVVQ